MSKYLLLCSKEGGEWKSAFVARIGSIEEISETFNIRKEPFILGYLIEIEKLEDDYNDYPQLDLLFFDILEKHPDLGQHNYQYDPFVGFYDMVATDRSWGILKDLAGI